MLQRQIEKAVDKVSFLAERIRTLLYGHGFPILTTFFIKTSTLLLAISSVFGERERSVDVGYLYQRIKEIRGKNG